MVWAERAMSNQTNHGAGTGDHCSTVSRNLGSTASRACISFLCFSVPFSPGCPSISLIWFSLLSPALCIEKRSRLCRFVIPTWALDPAVRCRPVQEWRVILQLWETNSLGGPRKSELWEGGSPCSGQLNVQLPSARNLKAQAGQWIGCYN
ncbi:hypothetical protein BDQ94DRAFT_141940 [Aspergillus welwitschiae]|uniref:Uncharacterized protein n=1 Tax=Aspergillus welwitschiae TaxID=1341132 RepID=A0A3F3Q4J3_9EURO|nr:hypothetical protein BDQ94DRAFT_141940 [Aspergillus welwitschiae]RDH34041.1 hypothetical protein BDQ94DRAFT_141940 [Aspergillus welwitschiae]